MHKRLCVRIVLHEGSLFSGRVHQHKFNKIGGRWAVGMRRQRKLRLPGQCEGLPVLGSNVQIVSKTIRFFVRLDIQAWSCPRMWALDALRCNQLMQFHGLVSNALRQGQSTVRCFQTNQRVVQGRHRSFIVAALSQPNPEQPAPNYFHLFLQIPLTGLLASVTLTTSCSMSRCHHCLCSRYSQVTAWRRLREKR